MINDTFFKTSEQVLISELWISSYYKSKSRSPEPVLSQLEYTFST